MPSILTRQPATPVGSHAVETVYTLVLATGVYLLVRLPTITAGVVLLLACAVWNRARNNAVAVPADQFRCAASNALGVMHTALWLVGWMLGPALAALSGSIPARISGLVILAAGLAAEWTDHDCRFSSRCTRKRPWEDEEDPL